VRILDPITNMEIEIAQLRLNYGLCFKIFKFLLFVNTDYIFFIQIQNMVIVSQETWLGALAVHNLKTRA
jgi:hypothetical protein